MDQQLLHLQINHRIDSFLEADGKEVYLDHHTLMQVNPVGTDKIGCCVTGFQRMTFIFSEEFNLIITLKTQVSSNFFFF